jgi:hypothetical protein
MSLLFISFVKNMAAQYIRTVDMWINGHAVSERMSIANNAAGKYHKLDREVSKGEIRNISVTSWN